MRLVYLLAKQTLMEQWYWNLCILARIEYQEMILSMYDGDQ